MTTRGRGHVGLVVLSIVLGGLAACSSTAPGDVRAGGTAPATTSPATSAPGTTAPAPRAGDPAACAVLSSATLAKVFGATVPTAKVENYPSPMERTCTWMAADGKTKLRLSRMGKSEYVLSTKDSASRPLADVGQPALWRHFAQGSGAVVDVQVGDHTLAVELATPTVDEAVLKSIVVDAIPHIDDLPKA